MSACCTLKRAAAAAASACSCPPGQLRRSIMRCSVLPPAQRIRLCAAALGTIM